MTKGINVIKEAGKMLLRDLWSIRYAVVCIFVYWGVTRILFRQFCPMVIVTGLPCPGCGMTRAAIRLLMLKFNEVWMANPAIYAWLIWGIWAAWKRYIKKAEKINHTKMLIVVFGITLLCYLWRMAVSFPSVSPMVYEQNNILERTLPFYRELINRMI